MIEIFMIKETITSDILATAQKVFDFMESRDIQKLAGVFIEDDAILIDSFSPYLFEGPDAHMKWAKGFIMHAKNLFDLQATIGDPQEFSSDGQISFLSLPIVWEGRSGQDKFYETGGLALVFLNSGDRWKIKNYAWAATSYKTLLD